MILNMNIYSKFYANPVMNMSKNDKKLPITRKFLLPDLSVNFAVIKFPIKIPKKYPLESMIT